MRNQALSGLRMFENVSESMSPTSSDSRPGDNNFNRQANVPGPSSGPASSPQARRGVSDPLRPVSRTDILLSGSGKSGAKDRSAKDVMLHPLRNGDGGH